MIITAALFLLPLAFCQMRPVQPVIYPQPIQPIYFPQVPFTKPPIIDAAADARWDLDGFLGGKIDKNGIKIGGGANLDTGVDFGLGIGQKRPTWPGDKIRVPDNGILGIGGRAEYGLGGMAGASLDANGLGAGIAAHEHKFIGLGATLGGKK